MILIRPLAASDLERIKEIDRAAFPPEEQYDDGVYDVMLQSGLSLVVEDEATTVGYAFVQVSPCTRVRSIAIHPSYRRLGYGRALLKAVIGRGEREVDLLVDEKNGPAMKLYRSLGFQPAEMCPTVPPRRRMVLELG